MKMRYFVGLLAVTALWSGRLAFAESKSDFISQGEKAVNGAPKKGALLVNVMKVNPATQQIVGSFAIPASMDAKKVLGAGSLSDSSDEKQVVKDQLVALANPSGDQIKGTQAWGGFYYGFNGPVLLSNWGWNFYPGWGGFYGWGNWGWSFAYTSYYYVVGWIYY